jgi:hypothetical protein
MSHIVGVKLSLTDNDGMQFTSAPAYVKAWSLENAIDISTSMARMLSILMDAGMVESYSIVLKCEADKQSQEAGQ